MTFIVKRGKYDVPGIGKVDTTKEVSDEQLLALYKLPRRVFPWITIDKTAASFLKKQKLTLKEIAALVQNARTVEEVEILAGLSSKKTIAGIVDVKLKAMEQDN